MSEVELPVCVGCGQQLEPMKNRLREFLKDQSDLLEKLSKEHGVDLFESDGPPEYGCGCAVGYMTLAQYKEYWKEEQRKREELGFVFRVNFNDNDFGGPVERACEDFLRNVSRGHVNSEGIENALKEIEKVGMENLRKFIVMAAFGHYITEHMRHWLISLHFGDYKDPYELEQYKDTLEYLDKNTTLEKVDRDPDEWENGEVCYIDLVKHTVQTH